MATNLETHMELVQLLHASVRYLDDQDYRAFLDLFSDDGEYSITSCAPELPQKMIWMRRSRQELAERIDSMDEHEWQVARMEQSRLISVDSISLEKSGASTSASFALYHTDDDGRSSLYVVGRYEDEWLRVADAWQLTKREVALKTRLLSMLSPLPI